MNAKIDSIRDSDPELKAKVDATTAKIPAESQGAAYRDVALNPIGNQKFEEQRAAAKVSA